MKKSKVKALLNWRIIGVLAIAIAVGLLFTLAGSTNGLYINGKKSGSENDPVYKNEILYVPLEPIVEGMGGTFKWVNMPYRVSVTKSDGSVIEFSITSSQATVDGKNVPVSTQTIKTVTVPYPAKPALIGKQLYIPYDAVQSVLGYPVKVDGSGKNVKVYVGTIPQGGQEVDPTPTPTPTTPEKPNYDLGYTPPDGWIPPTIKSTASDTDLKANWKALDEELGLVALSNGAWYNSRAKSTALKSFSVIGGDNFLAQIDFRVWKGSEYTPEDYRVPYIAREVFKFYLPDSYMTLYKIMDDGYNGKDISKYIGKILKYDGRQVKILETDFGVRVVIGKKGQDIS